MNWYNCFHWNSGLLRRSLAVGYWLTLSLTRAVVEQQMAGLSREDIVGGLVKAIKPYGAIVEVGGI